MRTRVSDVPRAALSEAPLQPLAMEMPPRFLTPELADPFALEIMPTFQAKVKPTQARITGVGYFDRVHDQTGVSPLNGLALHPILKIEFL